MIYINYITAWLFLLVTYSNSFKFSNKFIHTTRLNSFQYDYSEHSKYYQMELINWDENIDYDKFYYVVGHKNLDFHLLVNEMKIKDICCIFIPISTYQLEDIDSIFENLMKGKYSNADDFIKPEINDIKKFNNFLIFDQNKYIGGLFEMYSILYQDT